MLWVIPDGSNNSVVQSYNLQEVLAPVVRKADSAIHRIVIFSTVVKMLEKAIKLQISTP